MTPENYKGRCNMLLQALLGRPELVIRWWQSPNQHWQLRTPQEVFRDDPQQVYNYLLNFYDR